MDAISVDAMRLSHANAFNLPCICVEPTHVCVAQPAVASKTAS